MKYVYLFLSLVFISQYQVFGGISSTINILYEGGDYENSIKLIHREFRTKELTKQDNFDYYILLAEINIKLKNYKSALENNKANTFCSNKSEEQDLLHQKGSIFYHWSKKDTNKLDSAIQTIQKTHQLIQTDTNSKLYVNHLLLYGLLKNDLNENEALIYLNKGLRIAEKNNYSDLIEVLKLNISPLLINNNEIARAKAYLLTIKPNIDETNHIKNKYDLYKNLALLYRYEKDDQNEILALRKEIQFFEKLTEKNQKELEYSIKEEQKTEFEQKLRKLSNNKLTFRGRKRPKIIYVFGGLLLLSLLFIVFYFRINKKLKKVNLKLKDSVQLNKKIFSILSHDLKQPIYTLEAMFFLMDQDQLTDQEKEENKTLIKNHLKTTRLFMDDLMTWAKIEIGKENKIDETVNPHKISTSITELYREEIKDKTLNVTLDMPVNLEFEGNKMLYFIVLKNLIHNAVKFCFHSSDIMITHKLINGRHTFSVLNYGLPIPEELQDQMFDENKKLQYIIRNESKLGFGLGLSIISGLIKDNNGRIWLTKNSVDSTVEINFHIC